MITRPRTRREEWKTSQIRGFEERAPSNDRPRPAQVYSQEFAPADPSLTIPAWERAVSDLRRAGLPRDAFDAWMWNRVVFWADDGVQAFTRALLDAKIPYTTRAWPEVDGIAVVSLLLSSPKGHLVYEIRALAETAAYPTPPPPWDTCHPRPKASAA